MICPKCGEEMYDGEISAFDYCIPFSFLSNYPIDDDLVKHNVMYFAKKRFIRLTNRSFFALAKTRTNAFYCTKCKFVIVPVEKN